MSGVQNFGAGERMAVVADWLRDAHTWMSDMAAKFADYPERRHRAGERFPIRFKSEELNAFLEGLDDAAVVMREITAPAPISTMPAAPVAPALPPGWRVVK